MTLIFSPKWFYNIDSLFEFVSIIVGFLISYFSYRAYRIMKERRFIMFSASFFMMSLAFIFKIISNTLIYYKEMAKIQVGPFLVTGFVVKKNEWLEVYGHFLHMLMFLSAVLLLIFLVLDIKRRREMWLLLYFTILTAILSMYSYFVFHLTLAVMLSVVVYHFHRNCKAHPSTKSHLVFVGFLLVLVSQIVFIFNLLNPNFYVVGEVAQLLGFIALLVTYIMVRKK